jgi:hypothetical protein
MKQFHFSLEKALAWRRTQARMERLRWEQIRAEIGQINKARAHLSAEKDESAAAMRSAKSAMGEELAALETFGGYVISERARLEIKRVECEKRLAEQAKIVTARERDVKVLEHLRARRLDAWNIEWEKELEQQAAETYLARWRAPSKSSSTSSEAAAPERERIK